jgi:transcriptional regulator with XRE-family HTH domain
VREHLGHAERRVCRALHITRSSIRYIPQPRSDEAPLTQAVIALASQYGRFGYRRVHALVMAQGWSVSRSRVERIWKREGLKVPIKQPKRGQEGFADKIAMHRAYYSSIERGERNMTLETLLKSRSGLENGHRDTCSKGKNLGSEPPQASVALR